VSRVTRGLQRLIWTRQLPRPPRKYPKQQSDCPTSYHRGFTPSFGFDNPRSILSGSLHTIPRITFIIDCQSHSAHIRRPQIYRDFDSWTRRGGRGYAWTTISQYPRRKIQNGSIHNSSTQGKAYSPRPENLHIRSTSQIQQPLRGLVRRDVKYIRRSWSLGERVPST
jgi:hypothetical protein